MRHFVENGDCCTICRISINVCIWSAGDIRVVRRQNFGEIVTVVPLTARTRNTCGCPVVSLVIWCTEFTPAMVNASPTCNPDADTVIVPCRLSTGISLASFASTLCSGSACQRNGSCCTLRNTTRNIGLVAIEGRNRRDLRFSYAVRVAP